MSGCSTTKPWQRDTLAKPEMAPDGDEDREALRFHLLSTREGAVGGFGGGGGGVRVQLSCRARFMTQSILDVFASLSPRVRPVVFSLVLSGMWVAGPAVVHGDELAKVTTDVMLYTDTDSVLVFSPRSPPIAISTRTAARPPPG